MKQKNKQKQQTIFPVSKYKLYAVTLLCGLCVMVLELVGARMIAPFLGASIIVWTSLIGIIMASLAAGYYAGGRIADVKPSLKLLAAFIAGAALWVVLLAFIEKALLRILLTSGINNIYVLSILAAFLFFAIPSFLLATVSPFIIKIFTTDKSDAGIGGIAGRVSAYSTIGSIIGTFLGGFILVSFFSVTVILLFTALVLFIAAAFLFTTKLKAASLCLVVFAAFAGLYNLQKSQIPNQAIETMYNSLFIAEYAEDGRRVRALYTDSEKLQGRMFVDNPSEMAGEYLNFIADTYINNDTKSILMLGGGVYVLPRWLAVEYPDTNIDIVEIDPGITQAARDFFYLTDRPSQRIFHEDARYFVNRLALEGTKNYDLIFQDTYGSPLNVPFQLATVEYFRKVKTLLSSDGVFILNFIGSLNSKMFAGLHSAVQEAFTDVKVFLVNEPDNTETLQNIILAVYNSGYGHDNYPIPEYRGAFLHEIAAFTDRFAPVERYTLDMVR